MILATHEPQTHHEPLEPVSAEVAELEYQAKVERNHQQFGHYFAIALYYWNKIVTVLLMLYSVKETWSALKFIMVTSPELNKNQAAGLVTTHEVNHLTAVAITLSITVVISVFLAIRLHKVSKESEPTLELISAMLFLALSPALETFISMIDFVSLFSVFF